MNIEQVSWSYKHVCTNQSYDNNLSTSLLYIVQIIGIQHITSTMKHYKSIRDIKLKKLLWLKIYKIYKTSNFVIHLLFLKISVVQRLEISRRFALEISMIFNHNYTLCRIHEKLRKRKDTFWKMYSLHCVVCCMIDCLLSVS